ASRAGRLRASGHCCVERRYLVPVQAAVRAPADPFGRRGVAADSGASSADIELMAPRILPSIPNTLSTRHLLRTNLLAPLMRAAARAGVSTIGAVASWDNLTNKGPLVPRLDRLIVWNELMQAEAVRFHGYSAADVVVTGAAHHDLVFSGTGLRTDRAGFCG